MCSSDLLRLPTRALFLLAFAVPVACGDTPPAAPDLPFETSIWPEPEPMIDADAADNPWLRDFAAEGVGGGTTTPEPGGAPLGAGSGSGTGGTEGAGGGEAEPPPPPRWAVIRAYVETTSSAKALVIDEPGGAALAGCQVVLFTNGGTEPYRTFDLVSTTSRAVLCVGDPGIGCDDLRTGNAFNGDDAITLSCDGELRDVVGQVGVDPGDAWTGTGADGAMLSTKDQALWRCVHPTAEAGAFTWSEWMRWNPATDPLPQGPACPAPPEEGAAGAPPR